MLIYRFSSLDLQTRQTHGIVYRKDSGLMSILQNYVKSSTQRVLNSYSSLREMRDWNALYTASFHLMQEHSGRRMTWMNWSICSNWSRRRFGFHQDHAFSTLSMWTSSHVVQESTTCAGLVTNNCHAFVSWCSTREISIWLPDLNACATRQFLEKET